MFSEAYVILNRALQAAQRQNTDFHFVRDLLKNAKYEVQRSEDQPLSLRNLAIHKIDRAISYTYSRTNPALPFTHQSFPSMVSTPISPFQEAQQGPYGIVKGSLIPGQPTIVPTQWTTKSRESYALANMIREALAIVRQGL